MMPCPFTQPLRGRAVYAFVLSLGAFYLAQPEPATAVPPVPCHKCDSHAPDCSDTPDDDAGGFDTRELMSDTDVLHVDLDLEMLFSTQAVSGTCKMTVRN